MRTTARALLYLGIAVVVAGLSKVHAAYIADPPYDYTGSFRFAWSLSYAALLALSAYGFGLPDLTRSWRSALRASLGAAVSAAVVISVIQLVVGDALLPRFVVFGSAAVLVGWFAICSAISSGFRSRAEQRDRVLVVSDQVDAAALTEEIDQRAERPAILIGVLRVVEAVATADGSAPVREAAARHDVTVLVLDRDAQSSPSVVAQAAELHEAGVRVRTLSLFHEEWLGSLPLAELERISMMFDIGELHRARYGRLKRVVDVALALMGLVALVVVTPVVVLGNLIANRGPLLYRQTRVGRGGETFEILKFRTMRAAPDPTAGASAGDAAGAGAWTGERDPRITRFGHLLRVSHLDELPQVLNVLVGELSIVGPRPEQVHYVDSLTEKLPFYAMRHLVRPGLTGWAQVKYGYAGDDLGALEKLQYEFYYLRHQNLRLDARIIGRTTRAVLRGEGR